MVWKDLYDKGMFNLIKRICLFGELLKSIPGRRQDVRRDVETGKGMVDICARQPGPDGGVLHERW